MTMVVQRCVKHIMTSFKKFLFLLLFCSCHTCLRHPITVSPREDWQWILLFLIPISPFFYLFFLSHQPSVFFSAISHQCFFLQPSAISVGPLGGRQGCHCQPPLSPPDANPAEKSAPEPKNQPPKSTKNQSPNRKISPTSTWNKTSLQQDTWALLVPQHTVSLYLT